jgi:hypothetical protein
MRRFRYVDRVVNDVGFSGVGEVLDGAVPDPDAATEATARTGHDEAARDDRPWPRVPRRACPAMVHLFVLRPLRWAVNALSLVDSPPPPKWMELPSDRR